MYEKFTSGAFAGRKSTRVICNCHGPRSPTRKRLLKGDDGVVGLTKIPSALQCWMIGGPEIAKTVTEYEEQLPSEKMSTKHHKQIPSVQNTFLNVDNLLNAIEELGNPFKMDSGDLLAIDTKDIMPTEVVESIKNIKKIGQDQFKAFVSEKMIKPTRPITDPIKRNKPLLFSRPNTKDASKKQAKVVALKDDFSLFPGFISRANFVKGDLQDFFRHETSQGLCY